MATPGQPPQPPQGPQTPPPQQPAQPQQPVPPPAPAGGGPRDGKAGAGWRIGAVLLALVLAFVAAVAVLVVLEIADSPVCDDPAALEEALDSGDTNEFGQVECFDGSEAQQTISQVLGWPGAVLAAIAALAALAFAITGRRGRLVLQLLAAAVVLLVLAFLVGTV